MQNYDDLSSAPTATQIPPLMATPNSPTPGWLR